MTGDREQKAYFTWFGETLLYVSCRIWRCNNGLAGLVFVYLNEAWHYAECVSSRCSIASCVLVVYLSGCLIQAFAVGSAMLIQHREITIPANDSRPTVFSIPAGCLAIDSDSRPADRSRPARDSAAACLPYRQRVHSRKVFPYR